MFDTLRIMLAKRREFRRNATMNATDYEAMKLEKFRQLVAHAAQHSPYYQHLIAAHDIKPESCVPEDFPELTKAMLMANFDQIVTDKRITRQAIADFLSQSTDPTEKYLDSFRVIHTSGSSGEMGYFVYSHADWTRGMTMMMRPRLPDTPTQKRKPGRKRGRMRLAFYAATGGHFAGITMVSALASGIGRLFVKCEYFEVNVPLEKTIAALNEFQPDVLAGYTGALLLLARQQREGKLQIAPMTISTAGEGMSASDKAELESAFGCDAGNGYGSSEHLMMGGEIPGSSNMMLYDDDLIYECASDHTLTTNLFNFTVPLIRYRMSDILRPVASKTYPDLPYLEINAVIGRTEIMPVFTNEQGQKDSIHPIRIAEIFVANVLRFQLRWLSGNSFDFLVCLTDGLDEETEATALRETQDRLQEMLDQKQLGNVRFQVKAVSQLDVSTKTRKFQLIVDDRIVDNAG